MIDVVSVLPYQDLRELIHFAWQWHRCYFPINVSTFKLWTFTCLQESVNMTLVPLASCIKLQEIEFHGRTDVYSADIRPMSVCVYQTNFPCVVIKIFYSQSLKHPVSLSMELHKGSLFFLQYTSMSFELNSKNTAFKHLYIFHHTLFNIIKLFILMK